MMEEFKSENVAKLKTDGYQKVEEGDDTRTPANENASKSTTPFEELERPPLRNIDKHMKASRSCPSKRFTIALMACIGFIILAGMRSNMGLAKLQLEEHSYGHNKTFDRSEATFQWSVAVERVIDTPFFWGFLVAQLPGGLLASFYPANKVFGIAIACSAFFNFFLPGSFEIPIVNIIIRGMQGLFEGFALPAIYGIWRFWAPPLERSGLATMAFSGSYAGIVIGMPLTDILARWISWKAAFYFYGALGLIWFCFWLRLCFEKPRHHPAIRKQELELIENSLGDFAKLQMPAKIPWREIFRSMPVYAIIFASFCRSWSFYFLVIYRRKFLRHSFMFEIAEAGVLGALPYLLMTIIVPLGGILADHLRKIGIMTTTNVRKLFSCGGFGLEGLLFLFVAYAMTAFEAVTALTFGVAFSGFAISGFNVNHLDIAPRYASILMGISNGIGMMAGLICPIIVDFITRDPTEKDSWTTVFIIAACVHLTGIVFYGTFASGELQPWAEPKIEGGAKENLFNDDTNSMKTYNQGQELENKQASAQQLS